MMNFLQKISLLLLSASFIGVIPASKSNSSVEQNVILAQNTSETLQGALGGAIERNLENAFIGVTYPTSSNWGKQIRAKTGTKIITKKVCRAGFCYNEPRTIATYNNVNHGLWSRGTARLENEFDLDIRNFKLSNGQITFDVISLGLVRVKHEVRGYNHGVRLGSVSADTRTRTELTMGVKIRVCRDGNTTKWKTDVVAKDLEPKGFYLDRVGNIKGYSSQVIGDALEGSIDIMLDRIDRTYLDIARSTALKAITHDKSVKSRYARLTNLPSCQNARENQVSMSLAKTFGYMKNSRLVATGKSPEPMSGHINWAMNSGQSLDTVKNSIRHNLARSRASIAKSPSSRSCEAFGHMKNGMLSLLRGTTEDHQGHVNWCRDRLNNGQWNQVVSAMDREFVKPIQTALK